MHFNTCSPFLRELIIPPTLQYSHVWCLLSQGSSNPAAALQPEMRLERQRWERRFSDTSERLTAIVSGASIGFSVHSLDSRHLPLHSA